jgi:hypothetical protein
MMKRSVVLYRIKSGWPIVRRFRLFTVTMLLIVTTASLQTSRKLLGSLRTIQIQKLVFYINI